jgi:RNA polymerase sigma factor (sigma-70 family)
LKKQERNQELERAYRDNKKQYLSWTAKAVRSVTDAEDLVQEAFASAAASAESLAGIDDLAAWLFAVLRNKVRDFSRRRETRKKAGEADVAEELYAEIAAEAGLGPSDFLMASELSEALDEAIAALPEEQRAVIEAQVLDGFTFKEVAEMSGVSPDTLAARKRYAIKRLGASLREWIED